MLAFAVGFLSTAAMADSKDKKTHKENTVDSTEIQWLSVDDVQVKMHDQPRKVYVDIYTDWCGWCKRMDVTTFKDPNVIKYMNTKFYCVKLNAERRDSIRFLGKMYGYDAEHKSNTLAEQLLQGQMSYPTAVIFTGENFQNPIPLPGYQDVNTMEMVLKYVGENVFKTQKFEDYQKQFRGAWKQQPQVQN